MLAGSCISPVEKKKKIINNFNTMMKLILLVALLAFVNDCRPINAKGTLNSPIVQTNYGKIEGTVDAMGRSFTYAIYFYPYMLLLLF